MSDPKHKNETALPEHTRDEGVPVKQPDLAPEAQTAEPGSNNVFGEPEAQPQEASQPEPETIAAHTLDTVDEYDDSLSWEQLRTVISEAVETTVAARMTDVDNSLRVITKQSREYRQSVMALFEENQQSRGDIQAALVVPILRGLLRVLENLTAEKTRAEASGDEKLASILDAFCIDLLNTMEDFGLEEEMPCDVSESPRLDPRTQTVADTISGAPEQHKRVAQVLAPAYSFKGKPFTKERVIVFKKSTSGTV